MNPSKLGLIGFCLLCAFLLFRVFFLYVGYSTLENDIGCVWTEGKRIATGQNPYSRIVGHDMRNNRKYATHMPAFYLAVALSYKLGVKDFSAWIKGWRVVVYLLQAALGGMFFFLYWKRGQPLFSVGVVFFWLFNRWAFHHYENVPLDVLAVVLLGLGFLCYFKNRWVAFFWVGASLAVKHIGVFVLPILLLDTLRQSLSLRQKTVHGLKALGALSTAPVATALPFVIWDAEGFFKSLLFSTTRSVNESSFAFFLESVVRLPGPARLLGMALLMLLVYYLFYRGKLSFLMGCALTFAVFAGFTVILFPQYVIWLLFFVTLAFAGKDRLAALFGPPLVK